MCGCAGSGLLLARLVDNVRLGRVLARIVSGRRLVVVALHGLGGEVGKAAHRGAGNQRGLRRAEAEDHISENVGKLASILTTENKKCLRPSYKIGLTIPIRGYSCVPQTTRQKCWNGTLQ